LRRRLQKSSHCPRDGSVFDKVLLLRLLGRWSFNPPKLSLGFTILLSGHHFISYARNVVAQLESELAKPGIDKAAADAPPVVITLEEDRVFYR